MKKLDNFSNCLNVLKGADFELANESKGKIDEMLLFIRDSFTPAFIVLEKLLREKLNEIEGDWG